MTDRLVSFPSAAPDHAASRCLFAIELSGAGWLVAVLTPLADKVSLYKLESGDAAALLAVMERVRARVATALGHPVELLSCYEAGYDGFWLHRVLAEHGVKNHVFDPASLLVNRRARRAKSDRIDVHKLLRALSAYLRGEPQVVSVVHVPSPEEEDTRRLHRERQRLLSERVGHVNRIKGLCATQGIYDYEPLRRDRWARLAALRTGDGRPLRPHLAAEIGRELRRLEIVLTMLREVEGERDALIAKPALQPGHAATMQALLRLRGIGPETASVLVGEVFYRTFANRRELGGYVGLCPTPFSSGAMSREQGISKAGNPRARHSAVELAWRWLCHQPGSALARWFWARVGSAKGRPRRIAVVALARKLLVALWRYVGTGLLPQGAVLKQA